MARRAVQKRFCDQNHCSHYIDIANVRFYRGKFLWSTLIILMLVVLLFGGITYSYYCSQRKVIETHQQFSKDLIRASEKLCEKYDSLTILHVQLREIEEENEKNILSQMELQYEKIQSDFTVLSLWAGVLMVVFLIFSIYSMFKTDEIQHQSRDGLKRIDELSEGVKQKVESIQNTVKEALESVNKEADAEKKKLKESSETTLNNLKSQAESMEENFKKLVDERVSDFTNKIQQASETYNKMYSSAIERMDKLAQERKDSISELISEIRESGMGSRQDKNSEETGSGKTKI